ncbi:heat shock protein [Anaeramoeba flamelloides]|uniref:Heat shock protein n=1 Tax=Anaeramoeba flamelloides TaxID=1746091 RepID=A0AAV7ZSK5_9EUKA|nr:heat shock protein [Anaeramoeba flamelloides]
MVEKSTADLMITDLVEQMGCLLYFRECILNNIDIHDPESKAVPKEYFQLVKRSQNIVNSEVSLEQVEKHLQTLGKKIVFCSKQYLDVIIDSMKLIIEFDLAKFVVHQKKKSKKQPILKDLGKKSTKYFAFQTIYNCLHDLVFNNMSAKFSKVPKWFVLTLFEKVDVGNSKEIQYLSQRSIGLLSSNPIHFQILIDLYLKFFKQKIKKSRVNSYIKYTESIKMIQFTLETRSRSQITVNFLNQYSVIISKMKADETLRAEICKTVVSVFNRVFPNSSKIKEDTREKEKNKRLKRFERKNEKLLKTLRTSFEICYDTIKKWTKKSKSQSITYESLVQLLKISHYSFFSGKNQEGKKLKGKGRADELINFLSNGLKSNRELRISCLEHLCSLISNFNTQFIKLEQSGFTQLMSDLMPSLFLDPKKKIQFIDHDEIESIAEILYQIGLRSLSMIIDLMKRQLSNEKLRIDYKISVIRSLEKLCNTNPEEILDYEQEIFPLIQPYILEHEYTLKNINQNDLIERQGNEQLIAVCIGTFPMIMSQEMDDNSKIAKALVNLALSDEMSISFQAKDSIERYLLMTSEDENEGEHFEDIVIPILEILTNLTKFFVERNSSVINVKLESLLELLSLILKSFRTWILTEINDNEEMNANDNLETQIKKINLVIHYRQWVKIKLMFQSICIIWSFYDNLAINKKIIELLKLFNNKEFNALEAGLKKVAKTKFEKKKLKKQKKKNKKKKAKKGKKRGRKKKHLATESNSDNEEEDDKETQENELLFNKQQINQIIGPLINLLEKLNLKSKNSIKEKETKGELILWINNNFQNYKTSLIYTWNILSKHLNQEVVKKEIISKVGKLNEKQIMNLNQNLEVFLYFDLFGLLCGITYIPKKYYLDKEKIEIKRNEPNTNSDSSDQDETNSKKNKKKKKKKKTCRPQHLGAIWVKPLVKEKLTI